MTVDLALAIESQAITLEMEEEDANILRLLGAKLASNSVWWGKSEVSSARSVIAIERLVGNRYKVTFRDVVGLVKLRNVQIQVQPKIRSEHFRYLIENSELSPRLSARNADIGAGDDYVAMLCLWCIDAAEALLSQGLRPEYSTNTDFLPEARGSILPLETTLQIYRGRVGAVCEYDDINVDSSLNRLIKGACERVTKITSASSTTRARARHVIQRMDDVGDLQWKDCSATPDRLAKNYAKAASLSKLILGGCGIASKVGRLNGSTFLIRTPEMIEDGYRNILSKGLSTISVTKRRMMLGNTGLSMSPDLVFGSNRAIADVKYRTLTGTWNRPDLNQAVAFATAFGAPDCAVFGFVHKNGAELPRAIPVGEVRVRSFGWISSPQIRPQDSATQLIKEVDNWLHDKANGHHLHLK